MTQSHSQYHTQVLHLQTKRLATWNSIQYVLYCAVSQCFSAAHWSTNRFIFSYNYTSISFSGPLSPETENIATYIWHRSVCLVQLHGEWERPEEGGVGEWRLAITSSAKWMSTNRNKSILLALCATMHSSSQSSGLQHWFACCFWICHQDVRGKQETAIHTTCCM